MVNTSSFVSIFWIFDRTYAYYPEFEAMTHFQNGLRWNLDIFAGIIKQRFGIQIPHLRDHFPVFHNFLPREYMAYGTSLSKENKIRIPHISSKNSYLVSLLPTKIEDFDKAELQQIYLLTHHSHLLHTNWQNTWYSPQSWSKTLGTMVPPYRKYIFYRGSWHTDDRHTLALGVDENVIKRHHHTWAHPPERHTGNKENTKNDRFIK